MTAAASLVLSILCLVILFAPRRYALFAIFVGILFLSQRGGIELGGLRMHSGRLMELAAFIRVVSRRELVAGWFGPIDRAVILTYSLMTVAYLLRGAFGYGTSPAVTMTTPMSKIGDLVDILLVYFSFRGLVHELEDFRWLLRRIIVLLIPVVLCLAIERSTFSNPLTIFGSVPTVFIDDVDGLRIRCYGAFSHPALLGTLGAWLAISYAALVMQKEDRMAGVAGVGLALCIVLYANSGGPLTCLSIGLAGWACWFVRKRLRLIRIGIVVGLLLLAMVMKDPIWYLPSKMALVFGGSGWHRSYLMDQTIRHIGDWWLAGMPLDITASWFGYLMQGAADITNLYVAFGLDGGLPSLLLLIWLIVVAFRHVGRSMATIEGMKGKARHDPLLMWAIGCGLLLHVANYFSTTYFDQTNMLWLFQVAAVAGVSRQIAEQSAAAPAPAPAPAPERGGLKGDPRGAHARHGFPRRF